jgi:hypothetical protein
MAGMPKMQEQFLTAMDGGHAENAGAIFGPLTNFAFAPSRRYVDRPA